jgi:hypothetical protein
MAEIPVEHLDHDIHGVMVMVAPDDSVSIDPDCDCPPGCAGCEQEGVDR